MKKFLLATTICLALPLTSQAQTNLRTQFNDAMALFNDLIMQKEVGEALDLVRQDKVYTPAERQAMNEELSAAFPDPFIGSGTVQSSPLKNGFRQELLAFWSREGGYLYVYLVLHTVDNRIKVIEADYSTSLSEFISRF